MPNRSATPGRKFSTTTSLIAINRRTASRPPWRFQIYADTFLAAIHLDEKRALALAEWSDVPIVVAVGRLDLDHLRTDVGKQGRAEWSSHDSR